MRILFTLLIGLLFANTAAADADADSLAKGAQVFSDRCVLCHGTAGMGEGILPLKLADYPKTNLLTKKNVSREFLESVIKYGGQKQGLSDLMPPMDKELSQQEIEDVTDFVEFIRRESVGGNAMLKILSTLEAPNKRTGEHLFTTRCALCHGKRGGGNGRMAKVIKNPPPANLVTSAVNEVYVKQIIAKGGEGMGRSMQMPPWGDQMSESEIDSLVLFVMSLREK